MDTCPQIFARLIRALSASDDVADGRHEVAAWVDVPLGPRPLRFGGKGQAYATQEHTTGAHTTGLPR